MRSFLQWTAPVGALFAVAIVTDCGGSTTSTGGSDASTDSSSSSSGGSSSSSGSSSGGTGNCPTCTEPGMICCNGVDCSVDSLNDPDHCGACNVVCQGATPLCQQGKCVAKTPTNPGTGTSPGGCDCQLGSAPVRLAAAFLVLAIVLLGGALRRRR